MTWAAEPITGGDDVIRRALLDAELPSLLAALGAATGDPALLPERLRPSPAKRLLPQGGYTLPEQDEARSLAFAALTAARDGRLRLRRDPVDDEATMRAVRFLAGGDADRYLPLLLDELAAPHDPAAPRWHKDDLAPDRPFHVVVVGAGMSGLLAGHRLGQAGIPYTIVEKNDDVGGTWLENGYPGCRVDVSSHLYGYSFVEHDDWPSYFSTRDVLLDYFRRFADDRGVREHIRFGTEVLSAGFDDDTRTWKVRVRTPDGGADVLTAHAVVCAVGQLNRPHYPDIDGRHDFAGPSFHSARWDHDVDLTGRRVAVIGTGASAFQFVPEIARTAGSLAVFQRTAPWLAPTPHYHDPVADGLRRLFRQVPGYAQWYRFWLFNANVEGGLPSVHVDPAWPAGERAVSAVNDERRALLTAYLEHLFADRPDLLRAAVPDYPPGAKRMLRDNGVWAAALKRDNVTLVTDPIRRITEDGIVTARQAYDADVIVYATGFSASDFLVPMTVTGRGGADLHKRWNGDARAYLGMTVPEFPNLFLMYGPNTNIVINGSIIFFSECQAHYILQCLRLLLRDGHRALECREDVHDAYNELVDAANRERAWGASTVNSWYKNAHGRVSQNWPFTLMEYWERTRLPDPDDYRPR
ncbi:flavin-containing monooxygenase [Nonomuraea aridisoli]|uniref:NAD(P)/FAD-dependent oxidoreductase n=1 Tax=Nonomuraea aridisoli TaxID=2070368 RepID=A0A2W2E6P1_9ACTN|nr:NAD(P)/FAD-dependent oxidoreductase [Nonomuraea aridisoli]PZG18223.1 NAD(P)/FAD-dependent oxidoreductase [Nonomuraea aridisoli]